MSDAPNHWWNSTIPEEPAVITEQTLRDAITKMRDEQNVVAEQRAARGVALAEWWRSQPEAVRESEAGMSVYMVASMGHAIHPAVYERLAAAITELGGTMP